MAKFSIFDYLVIGVYLASMVVMGILFSGRQKSLKEYFHAGGNVPWWAVGISLIATHLSPISYLALPGWIFERDTRSSITGGFIELRMVLPAAALWIPIWSRLRVLSIQRHPMPAVGLHPPGRDRPHTPGPIGLLPLDPPHLTPPGCRQHQELEGQPGGRQGRRSPHRPDSRSHLPMGQGLQVLDNVLLGAQHRADPVAGVVDPVLHGHGPFQDRTQAQAHPPGRLRLPVPDGREDLKQVGAGNLRDRHLADAREGQPPQARQPLAGVFPVAPAGPLLFQHTGSSFGVGGDGLATSLLGERVPALAGPARSVP